MTGPAGSSDFWKAPYVEGVLVPQQIFNFDNPRTKKLIQCFEYTTVTMQFKWQAIFFIWIMQTFK